jgi:hypothetical protein
MRSPTHWGAKSTFKASNSKHPQRNLALWSKTTKFTCLVIWTRGTRGIKRSPTCWRSNSTLKSSNSKQPQRNLAHWVKSNNFRSLVIWNHRTGGIKRSPSRWGAKPTFNASNSKHPQRNLALWSKTTNFRCLVIWNWVLTLTAWSCNLYSTQKNLHKKPKKNHVTWNFNIHVICFLSFCKPQGACEEYKS